MGTGWLLVRRRQYTPATGFSLCILLLTFFAAFCSAVQVEYRDCLNHKSVPSDLYFTPYKVESSYVHRSDVVKGQALFFTVHGVMTGTLQDLDTTTNKFSKYPLRCFNLPLTVY